MKIFKKFVLIPTLVTLSLGMACCTTVSERGTEPAGSPPVITSSFASEKVSHGDIWRIYLEANDPDGDMRYFAYSIKKSGLGGRFEYVRIRKGDRARLSGFIGVVTSPPQDAIGEWARLTLTLYIQDRSGNTSDKVTFPVALSRGVKQGSPPPPFDIEGLKRLGQIWVELPRLPTGGP
jgi:hypothetical protein